MFTTEQFAYTTVRIETVSAQGPGSGTGFIAGFFADGNGCQPVLVTNKHVVSGASGGVIRFHLADASGAPIKGAQHSFHITNFSNCFVGHPDAAIDLCVMPIGGIIKSMKDNGTPAFISIIYKDSCPTSVQWNEFLSVENVTMIGYPSGIWDSANNRPLLRKGITATSLSFDYENRREFLIDIATFPGSSGSPVFLMDLGMYIDKNGSVQLGSHRFYFVGVVHSMIGVQQLGNIITLPIPTQINALAQYNTPLHLGVAVKSTAVWEIEPAFAARFPMPSP